MKSSSIHERRESGCAPDSTISEALTPSLPTYLRHEPLGLRTLNLVCHRSGQSDAWRCRSESPDLKERMPRSLSESDYSNRRSTDCANRFKKRRRNSLSLTAKSKLLKRNG